MIRRLIVKGKNETEEGKRGNNEEKMNERR